jgi:hypothetical protein
MGTRTQYSLNDLTGTANKYLRVNSGETGIETYDTKITNTYRISKTGGDFEFIGEAFAFLNALPGTDGVRLILDAGLWNISLDPIFGFESFIINSTHPIYFEGSGVNTTTIIYDKDSFSLTLNSSVNISKIKVIRNSNTTNYEFVVLNNSNVDFEIADIYFESFIKAINIKNAKSIFLFNFVFDNTLYAFPAGSCVYCDTGTGTTILDIEIGTINRCGGSSYYGAGIYLKSGTDVQFDIHSVFFHPTVDVNHSIPDGIGILYNPAGFTYADHPSITGCKWDNTGTFMSGFDFSRHDGRDRNIVITNNVGMENKNPHSYLNLINNTTSTTLANNVWTKLNFTGTTVYENKIIFTGNRFTYLPSNVRDLTVFGSGTLTTTTQPANIEIVIVKNGNTGTTISPVSVTLDSNSKKFQWSSNAYLQSVGENDYFEIWGRGKGANETIIPEDMNLLITSV